MYTRPSPLIALVLAACAAAPDPAPAELGNRIRITVEGRGREPSITTADYWLLFVVRDANGRRLSLGVHASEWADSASVAGELGAKIQSALETPPVRTDETLQGIPEQAHDIVLPPGIALCFEAGCHYAYRVVDANRREAELQPEIRVAMLSADSTGYVELRPGAGPPIGPAQLPPNWPPAGVE